MRDASRVSLALLLAMTACAPVDDVATGSAVQASVCAGGTVLQGVDVSVYQGTVNWTNVHASGRAFAIARISDGTYLDTEFATNWSGIHAAGMVRGAYQFFEPGDDPVAQANIVITAVGMLGAGDLPVTADMEVTGGESAATIVAHLQTWAIHVQAGTGRAPMIYTAPGFWNASVDSTAFGSDPLWAANWGVTCPTLATGWSNWVVWQYSDSGSVSGISGGVDLDEFNGDMAALNMLANGAAAPQWGGAFVMQSFPYASVGPIQIHQGDTAAEWIEMRNSGTTTWDTNTRLGTTQPRDRTDPFAGSDWIAPNRPSGVTGTVAPGGTFRFNFTFNVPATMAPGMYTEYFGMLEEGVTWFSAAGELGPPDDQLEAIVQVLPSVTPPDSGTPMPDAGEPDSGTPMPDAGEPMPDVVTIPDAGVHDGGNPETDANAVDVGSPHDGNTATDGGVEGDTGTSQHDDQAFEGGVDHDGGDAGTSATTAGCACAVRGTRRSEPRTVGLVLFGFVIVASRRRRRRLRALRIVGGGNDAAAV